MSTCDPTPTASSLSQKQLEAFERDGFLVINEAISAENIESMKTEIASLVHKFDAKTVSVFTTNE